MTDNRQATDNLSRRSFAGLAGVAGASMMALAALAPLTAHADQDEDDDATIVADASASIKTSPDIADVIFSVETAKEDAVSAQDEAAAIVDAAVAALAGMGIAQDAVSVSNMNIWPLYDYGDGSMVNNEPRISGYQVHVEMSVNGIAIDQIGDVISTVVGAGVNGVGGVNYRCSNYDDVYDQALTEACARATHKAEVMAAALGYKISGIESANTGYENQRYKSASVAMGASSNDAGIVTEEAAMDMAAVAFDPGTVDIEANVSITFEVEKL